MSAIGQREVWEGPKPIKTNGSISQEIAHISGIVSFISKNPEPETEAILVNFTIFLKESKIELIVEDF